MNPAQINPPLLVVVANTNAIPWKVDEKAGVMNKIEGRILRGTPELLINNIVVLKKIQNAFPDACAPAAVALHENDSIELIAQKNDSLPAPGQVILVSAYMATWSVYILGKGDNAGQQVEKLCLSRAVWQHMKLNNVIATVQAGALLRSERDAAGIGRMVAFGSNELAQIATVERDADDVVVCGRADISEAEEVKPEFLIHGNPKYGMAFAVVAAENIVGSVKMVRAFEAEFGFEPATKTVDAKPAAKS